MQNRLKYRITLIPQKNEFNSKFFYMCWECGQIFDHSDGIIRDSKLEVCPHCLRHFSGYRIDEIVNLLSREGKDRWYLYYNYIKGGGVCFFGNPHTGDMVGIDRVEFDAFTNQFKFKKLDIDERAWADVWELESGDEFPQKRKGLAVRLKSAWFELWR